MTSTSRIRLDDPGALAAAVPYLLGFVPSDSLVAVGLRPPRSRVCLTVRVDLAAVAAPAVVPQLAAQLRHAGSEAVVLVLVGRPADMPEEGGLPPAGEPPDRGRVHREGDPSERARVHREGAAPDRGAGHRSGDTSGLPGTPAHGGPRLPHRGRADEARRQCRAAGLTVLDVLWVDAGRWWSYLCGSPCCCPAEGSPVEATAAEHLAAELAGRGRRVLPDRQSLERSVAPDLPFGADAAAQTVVRAYTEFATLGADDPRARLDTGAELLRAAVARCAPGCPGLDTDERGRLTALLHFRGSWDGVLQWLDGPHHDAAQALLLELTRASPPPWGATPAALLALYAYARGDGALARVCADRALADDPGHGLGTVVHRMLDGGAAPEQVIAAIRKGVRRCSRLSSP